MSLNTTKLRFLPCCMLLMTTSCHGLASDNSCITKADHAVGLSQAPVEELHFPQSGAIEIKPTAIAQELSDTLNKSLNGQEPLHNITVAEKIGSSTIVGFDDGEWGGSLVLLTQGRSKISELKNGNVQFAFKSRGTIYVVSGLSHLSHSEGALWKVEQKEGHPIVQTVFEFPSEAERVLGTENNEVVFVTNSHSFALTQNGQIRTCN